MSRYSLGLALEDFVPSALSLVAFLAVTRIARSMDERSARWALAGGLLVVAGGLSRATWKLVLSTTGADVELLYLALYPALAFGFPTLATATWRAARATDGGQARIPAALPGALVVLILVPLTVAFWSPEGRLVPLLWLVAGTMGSAALSLVLARWARRAGRPRVAALLLLNLATTLIINGVARSAQSSEAIQWVQQGINTVNQLLFLLAVRTLEPSVVTGGERDATADRAASPAEARP